MLADKKADRQTAKRLFSPMRASSESYTAEVEQVTADLAQALQVTVPQSCFVQLYTSTPFPQESPRQLPETVVEVFQRMSSATLDEKVAALAVTDADIVALAEATVEQSESDTWRQYRQGRITASIFHSVCTRMRTVAQQPQADCSRLVDVVLGGGSTVVTAATKHGLSMEVHAVDKYVKLMRTQHKHFHANRSGLFLYKPSPFIAASPDLLVDCKCHGAGLCEIKSPFSTRHLPPSADHLRYLESIDGQSRLKRNSQYYYQIQGQMGVTGRTHCDFFVYTAFGYHLERIPFEQELWDAILSSCTKFWFDFVVPKLSTPLAHVPTDDRSEPSTSSSVQCDEHAYYQPPHKKCRACPLTAPTYPVVCLCGVCHSACTSDVEHFSPDSIQCSSCFVWFHHDCVNVHSPEDMWLCDHCLTVTC